MGVRLAGCLVLSVVLTAACSAPTAPAATGSPAVTTASPGASVAPSRQSFRHEADLPTDSPPASTSQPPASAFPAAVDACLLVTRAEVEAIVGASLAEPEPEGIGPGGEANTCHYPDETGERLVSLVVLALGDATGTYATIASDTEGIDRTYSDLGDAAVCTIEVLDIVTLYALHGSRLIEVITSNCGLAEAVARLALSRL